MGTTLTVCVLRNTMLLSHPSSPQAAQALADRLGANACFIAGGTLLQQSGGESRAAPVQTQFINIQHWPHTQQIHRQDGHVRIGAGVRLETARTHALLAEHTPLLVQAITELGAMGVRRLGTLGGNIGWREGDCCPVLLAMDALVELADGSRHALADVLLHPVCPLMVAFWLPIPSADARQPMVFEKVGYRAAFSPARLRMALRWSSPDRGCSIDRITAAAPGLPVHRLLAAEALLVTPHDTAPTLTQIRTACLQTLPTDLSLMASRLIAGHCNLLMMN